MAYPESVWTQLDDVAEGRPNLGSRTTVAAYRLAHFALRQTLEDRFGPAEAAALLREAGRRAGHALLRDVIGRGHEPGAFLAEVARTLADLAIGVLRVESADFARGEFVMTIAEDLECSGLPVGGEAVCEYDEGFLAGLLEGFTGRTFVVREVDCWSTGERVCRFRASAG